MKKHLSTAAKFVFSLGLGLLIVWFTFSKLTDDERETMRSAFANANYSWLLLGGFFNLASNYFRTQRWRMLLKPMGHNPGYWNTFFSVIVMYFANLLFPRLGEVMRCGLLNKYENIPVNRSIGTMVTERIVDLLTLFSIGGILILTQKDVFYESLTSTKQITESFGNNPMYSYIFYAVVTLVGLFVVYKVVLDRTWIHKIINFIKGMLEGLRSVLKTEKPLLFMFHSIIIWVFYFLAGYVSFFAIPETSAISLGGVLAVLFFGGFAYAAVQGGLGAYPAVVAILLPLYGIPDVGLAMGWLMWTVLTGLVIISGILSLLALSIINKS